ncbi:Arm DNA-binding domain-containing protein [Xanthomonas euroxanthea]|uniref:Arm DNA-binding domain-containing protein n=1 Tax=Xanthomonas euroxanthea TaxID=2259622 RepID=UPI002DD62289|nr:Arm DNA-binding domain-containing protein [Xanthomonas euroxanthea]
MERQPVAPTHKYLTPLLTDAKLRALKPKVAAFRVADSNGLCIEVRPTASEAWCYRYRYAGKPRIVTIGEYPAMSLMQARAERVLTSRPKR